MNKTPKDLSGCRILIIAGEHAGEEGICLGKSGDGEKWAITPDGANDILELVFEKEFGLLLDMSGDTSAN